MAFHQNPLKEMRLRNSLLPLTLLNVLPGLNDALPQGLICFKDLIHVDFAFVATIFTAKSLYYEVE